MFICLKQKTIEAPVGSSLILCEKKIADSDTITIQVIGLYTDSFLLDEVQGKFKINLSTCISVYTCLPFEIYTGKIVETLILKIGLGIVSTKIDLSCFIQ